MNDDFERQTGRRFSHFFCPILQVDENAALCAGHVIPDALGGTICVPQRADVDNFFGYAYEGWFTAAVKDRSAGVTEILFDPEKRKLHKPTFEYQGKKIEHYFPKDFREIPGQTTIHIVDGEGCRREAFKVKVSSEELRALCDKDIELSVERDYTLAVVVSVIKAAHLTLFRMMGYRYVFSVPGLFLASVLSDIFRKHREKSQEELSSLMLTGCNSLSNLISPVNLLDESVLGGTLQDQRMLACCAATTGIFAIGVIIKAGPDAFCVFLPTDQGTAIDTYFSFLAERPQSIAVRLLQFITDGVTGEGEWQTPKGDAFRVQLQLDE